MAALLGLAFAVCLCISTTPTLSVAFNNEGSVLQALLESQYSEWMELVDHAAMLHPLEQLVGSGDKLTIFAPQNHLLPTKVKSFLLKPANAIALRRVVQFHVMPQRFTAGHWHNTSIPSMSGDGIPLSTYGGRLFAGEAEVVAPDSIVCADGVVHGVDGMLLPNSVMREYVAHSTRDIATPLPTGAPELDSRRARLFEKSYILTDVKLPVALAFAPSVSIETLSPLGSPAPAPGPGPSAAPWLGFGDEEVTTFITAMLRFGGYTEFAGLLVDLTSLGSEISKLVNMGYKLTILAPDDKAWENALTVEQLNSPSAIEHVLHYHIISEYQTEESLYSTLRRMGKLSFSTLKVPLKLSAREVDGSVMFGEGEGAAGVYDHDIFADGRISVQGINKVLIPPDETTDSPAPSPSVPAGPPPPPKTKARVLTEALQLPSTTDSVGNAGQESSVREGSFFSVVAACAMLLLHLLT